jgi:class 3 adenylate cyclase
VPPQSEPRVERRLAAIFAADVAGYSRLMSQDEAGTLRALAAAREIMDGLIAEHGGRIANTAGDSVLAEFPSVATRQIFLTYGAGLARSSRSFSGAATPARYRSSPIVAYGRSGPDACPRVGPRVGL